jgi:flagellar biosynthesis protein FlhB
VEGGVATVIEVSCCCCCCCCCYYRILLLSFSAFLLNLLQSQCHSEAQRDVNKLDHTHTLAHQLTSLCTYLLIVSPTYAVSNSLTNLLQSAQVPVLHAIHSFKVWFISRQ